MPTVRVIECEPLTDPRWLSFVLQHPERTIYHHPAWIRVLEDEFAQAGEHLACQTSDGQLVAVLPMLRTKGMPFNFGGHYGSRRLASLPRTPIAGPLSNHEAFTAMLLREAIARTSRSPGVQLQIKTSTGGFESLTDGIVCRPWRHSYILDLRNQPKDGFRIPDGKQRAKIKWSIQKSARLGVTVRVAEDISDLRKWYGLYLQTMRRSVVPPRPLRFFMGLWHVLRPLGVMELLVAEQVLDGKPRILAGSIYFGFGDTVSYAFNGMDRNFGSSRANDAITWHAINEACQRSFQFFDFGEVPDGHADLAKFKNKWGAEPKRLYRYYSMSVSDAVTVQKDPGYWSRFLRSLWTRIPVTTTAWLGEKIYQYL